MSSGGDGKALISRTVCSEGELSPFKIPSRKASHPRTLKGKSSEHICRNTPPKGPRKASKRPPKWAKGDHSFCRNDCPQFIPSKGMVSRIQNSPKGEPRGDQRRPRGGQKEPKEHQNGPKKIIPFVVCQLAFSLPAFSSEKHILIGVALAA